METRRVNMHRLGPQQCRWQSRGDTSSGYAAPSDVAQARSSDRYGKFDWWSHDVGDLGF
jgi:hypothetical protein